MINPKEVSPKVLAEAAGISVNILWEYSRRTSKLYKPTREKRMSNGKIRAIDPPTYDGKKFLKKLHKAFVKLQLYSSAAHGGIKRRSSFSSARQHLAKPQIGIRDVQNCFPSITEEMLRDELFRLGFPFDTVALLSRLFTVHGRIPQGSPISGDAVNIYLLRFDTEVLKVCGSAKTKFTRMIDDCVVSGVDASALSCVLAFIETRLSELGLTINEDKKAAKGWLPLPEGQEVHGLDVRSGMGVAITKEKKFVAHKLAQTYIGSARSLQSSSLQNLLELRKSLVGWICYSRQAELSPAVSLQKSLDTGDRFVREFLKRNKISLTQNNEWWKKKEFERIERTASRKCQ